MYNGLSIYLPIPSLPSMVDHGSPNCNRLPSSYPKIGSEGLLPNWGRQRWWDVGCPIWLRLGANRPSTELDNVARSK